MICIKCSGVHRNLGKFLKLIIGSHISKLQSIVLDTKWNDSAIDSIKSKGNKKVNEELEYFLSQSKSGNYGTVKPNTNSTT